MAGTIVASTINTDTGLFSTNNAYSGIAKAWVNFTGSSGGATVNSSFNVSSVTRNATGDYTINFTTAMPNVYYTVSGQTNTTTGTVGAWGYPWTTAPNVNSARLYISNYAYTQLDNTYNSFVFHSS